MGLVQAFVSSVGGTLADQWQDFYTVPSAVKETDAVFPARQLQTSSGRGSNTSGSSNVITNGSKILIPDGYGLLTVEDGKVTGFASEPGGYIWDTASSDSQSIFVGDGLSKSLLAQSWKRFKFGGIPSSNQSAIFIRLAELPNNKFGTTSEIYWHDPYLKAQVGTLAHGTYSLKIVDPIKFVSNFLSANFTQGIEHFDFTSRSNNLAEQIRSELLATLGPAFSAYVNKDKSNGGISRIQADALGFSKLLAGQIDEAFSWVADRGIQIANVALMGIKYDDATRELLKTVQRADALAGNRGNSNLQASVAEGIQSAGETGGAAGLVGLGIASGSLGVAGMMQQNVNSVSQEDSPSAGLRQRLSELKSLFDDGLISEAEYATARSKILGN